MSTDETYQAENELKDKKEEIILTEDQEHMLFLLNRANDVDNYKEWLKNGR